MSNKIVCSVFLKNVKKIIITVPTLVLHQNALEMSVF